MKTALVFTVLIAYLIQAGWANEACSASSKPDFRAPGRRISEEKCREYNWERKCSSAQDVDVNEHPYLGAIAYRKEDGDVIFACAATLISPKFAVTTGHCSRNIRIGGSLTPEFVRFGNKNLKAEAVIDAKIVNKISYPQSENEREVILRKNDIGLLQFENALPLNKAVTPACLWSQEIGSDVTKVSAWGTTGGNKLPDVLRTMEVQIMDSESCKKAAIPYFNRKFPKLEDQHLCVNDSSDPKEYFSKGSSGAPIVISAPVAEGEDMSYIKAFATFGTRYRTGAITFYTKIPNYIDWIEQQVWGTTPL
uniref:Trypsin-like proteinase n=1 Tax=Chilo suppressalis TaxID=168631 RepID=I3UII7_CHISP|nr:trypsin-like proteinase [Chilo suppressalis]